MEHMISETITSGSISIKLTQICVRESEVMVHGEISIDNHKIVFERSSAGVYLPVIGYVYTKCVQHCSIQSREPYLYLKCRISNKFNVISDSKYFTYIIPFKSLPEGLTFGPVWTLAKKLDKLNRTFCKRKSTIMENMKRATEIIKSYISVK